MNVRDRLGVSERSSVWRSTLTGAVYRWDQDQGWMIAHQRAAQWHPVSPLRLTTDVYARASEQFEEYTRDS